MEPLIEKNRGSLERLCRLYGVKRLDLFGSATRADFDPDHSDLDFLVEFDDLRVDDAADRFLGLFVDLEDLFKRRVDLVSVSAIRNPFFRQVVEKNRVLLYAA